MSLRPSHLSVFLSAAIPLKSLPTLLLLRTHRCPLLTSRVQLLDAMVVCGCTALVPHASPLTLKLAVNCTVHKASSGAHKEQWKDSVKIVWCAVVLCRFWNTIVSKSFWPNKHFSCKTLPISSNVRTQVNSILYVNIGSWIIVSKTEHRYLDNIICVKYTIYTTPHVYNNNEHFTFPGTLGNILLCWFFTNLTNHLTLK